MKSPLRHVPEPYRPLARQALRSGWSIAKSGKSGHVRWISPDGRTVWAPASPSDHRSYRDVVRKLRAAGLAH